MDKEEFILRYGKETYEKLLEENRERVRTWKINNPERVEASQHECNRKGGKHYEKILENSRTGLRHERNLIRSKDRNKWRQYKQIIAPESQCHHEWDPGTANYAGVALVEADQHRHGIIDVIKILEGEITLFTEKEISATCPGG